jgi:hypothetical protein
MGWPAIRQPARIRRTRRSCRPSRPGPPGRAPVQENPPASVPAANVARATLYRHFPSGNDLLAAAFNNLIPASPMPPEEGSLRDRLIALVLAQAEFVAGAPTVLTAMSWLALGRDLEGCQNLFTLTPLTALQSPPCASASPSNTRRRSTRYSIAQTPRS